MYYIDEQMTEFQKIMKASRRNLVDRIINKDEKLEVKQIMYNLRIFTSEKIGVDGEVKDLGAIALTTFFCRRYIFGMHFVSKAPDSNTILEK